MARLDPKVEAWLRELGGMEYESAFLMEKIDWEALQLLNENDLVALGVKLGDRKKMGLKLKSISKEKVATPSGESHHLDNNTSCSSSSSSSSYCCSSVLHGLASVLHQQMCILPTTSILNEGQRKEKLGGKKSNNVTSDSCSESSSNSSNESDTCSVTVRAENPAEDGVHNMIDVTANQEMHVDKSVGHLASTTEVTTTFVTYEGGGSVSKAKNQSHVASVTVIKDLPSSFICKFHDNKNGDTESKNITGEGETCGDVVDEAMQEQDELKTAYAAYGELSGDWEDVSDNDDSNKENEEGEEDEEEEEEEEEGEGEEVEEEGDEEEDVEEEEDGEEEGEEQVEEEGSEDNYSSELSDQEVEALGEEEEGNEENDENEQNEQNEQNEENEENEEREREEEDTDEGNEENEEREGGEDHELCSKVEVKGGHKKKGKIKREMHEKETEKMVTKGKLEKNKQKKRVSKDVKTKGGDQCVLDSRHDERGDSQGEGGVEEGEEGEVEEGEVEEEESDQSDQSMDDNMRLQIKAMRGADIPDKGAINHLTSRVHSTQPPKGGRGVLTPKDHDLRGIKSAVNAQIQQLRAEWLQMQLPSLRKNRKELWQTQRPKLKRLKKKLAHQQEYLSNLVNELTSSLSPTRSVKAARKLLPSSKAAFVRVRASASLTVTTLCELEYLVELLSGPCPDDEDDSDESQGSEKKVKIKKQQCKKKKATTAQDFQEEAEEEEGEEGEEGEDLFDFIDDTMEDDFVDSASESEETPLIESEGEVIVGTDDKIDEQDDEGAEGDGGGEESEAEEDGGDKEGEEDEEGEEDKEDERNEPDEDEGGQSVENAELQEDKIMQDTQEDYEEMHRNDVDKDVYVLKRKAWTSDGKKRTPKKQKVAIQSNVSKNLSLLRQLQREKKGFMDDDHNASGDSDSDGDGNGDDICRAEDQGSVSHENADSGANDGSSSNLSNRDSKDRAKRKRISSTISNSPATSTLKNKGNKSQFTIEERWHKYSQDNDDDEVDNAVNIAKRLIAPGDIDKNEHDVLIEPHLASVLKPHQLDGIKFMWENLMLKKESGCVLAHSMGLGKTLQTIALLHTLHYCDHVQSLTPSRTYLLLAPASVTYNWKAEFDLWLNENSAIPKVRRKIPVYFFGGIEEARGKPESKNGDQKPSSSIESKRNLLEQWKKTGGVFIVSFETYRTLLSNKPKKSKDKDKNQFMGGDDLSDEEHKNLELLRQTIQSQLSSALIRPGPDLIIVDEGQRIKEKDSQIFKIISQVETRKRLILTGYPLQNNLEEFWTMIEFVRPGFFASIQDFKNRFIVPIQNGQYVDSTPSDVRIMLQRLTVLNELVSGFVHRLGPNILAQELPPKTEVVLTFRLGDVQLKLYKQLLLFMSQHKATQKIFEMANIAMGIINHPDIVRAQVLEKYNHFQSQPPIPITLERACRLVDDPSEAETETETELGDRVPGTTTPIRTTAARTTSTWQSDSITDIELAQLLAKNGVAEKDIKGASSEHIRKIASALVASSDPKCPSWSWPLFLDNYQPGEICTSGKFVVLKTILEESVLLGEKVLVFTQSIPTMHYIESLLFVKHFGWKHDRDYFRIDGTVPTQVRTNRISAFNSTKNMAKVFIISTKAGGVGVNLVAATRVVSFDTCWNPCHDRQSVFRCYRYGQTRPVFVYSLVGGGVAEEVIYWRQIHKESLFKRVVERGTAKRTLRKDELDFFNCLSLEPPHTKELQEMQRSCQDPILERVLAQHSSQLVKCHFHQVQDDSTATLTDREREEGWKLYHESKNMSAQPQGKRIKPILDFSNSSGNASSDKALQKPTTISSTNNNKNNNSTHKSKKDNLTNNSTLTKKTDDNNNNKPPNPTGDTSLHKPPTSTTIKKPPSPSTSRQHNLMNYITQISPPKQSNTPTTQIPLTAKRSKQKKPTSSNNNPVTSKIPGLTHKNSNATIRETNTTNTNNITHSNKNNNTYQDTNNKK